LIELSIGKIDLSSGNSLGCQQTKKEYKDWIEPSFFHIIRGSHSRQEIRF
jgi:hypothetical protein